MNLQRSDMRRSLSDIFKNIQISWLEKVQLRKSGSAPLKSVGVKENGRKINSRQFFNKAAMIVTPKETRLRGDLSTLTKIYRRHLFSTLMKKTSFSLVSKPPTVFLTASKDEMFVNTILDEICACNDINDNDQGSVAEITVEITVDKTDDLLLSINPSVMKNSSLHGSTVNHLMVPATPTANAEAHDYNYCQYPPVISDLTAGHFLLSIKSKLLHSSIPLSSLFIIPILNQNFSLRSRQMKCLQISADKPLLTATNDRLKVFVALNIRTVNWFILN